MFIFDKAASCICMLTISLLGYKQYLGQVEWIDFVGPLLGDYYNLHGLKGT